MMKSGLIVFGTRPELIKLWPVSQQLKQGWAGKVFLCNSGQHPDLLRPFLEQFSITADFTAPSLQTDRSLNQLSAHLLTYFQQLFSQHNFSFVMVQGDTLSSMIAGLAA